MNAFSCNCLTNLYQRRPHRLLSQFAVAQNGLDRREAAQYLQALGQRRCELTVGSCYLTAYRHDDGQAKSGPPSISSPYLLLVVTARFERVEQGWRIQEQVMKREFEFAGAG